MEVNSMSRKVATLTCDENTFKKLLKIAGSRTEEARMVLRAKIILSCLKGSKLKVIAKENGVKDSTVIKWRERFRMKGIEGLNDQLRSGKPKTYDQIFKESVLKVLEKEPPNGMSKWDGPTVAKELNVSTDAVWRLLRKLGICLARQRTWCISTDPYFVSKAADIVGLYLNPPENALVIAVDEKPAIQALERRTGYVVTKSKKIVQGLQSTYKRHGTLNLFAAMEVMSGNIKGKVTTQKKRIDFISFMDELVADYPPQQELHVIMDNHCIHKKLDAWLSIHSNVFFHYTPTSASWLNMIEIWFGIFTRKVLKGASFKDTNDLSDKITRYISAYKEIAHPFIWKKREVVGSQLKYNIRNLCN